MNKPANSHAWFTTPGIFILLTLCGLLVGFAGYLYFEPAVLRRSFKIFLPVVLLLASFFLYRSASGKKFVPVFLGFFAVALGFAVDIFAGSFILEGLGWTVDSPRGWAVAKLNEAAPGILCILAVALLAGDKFKTMNLGKGRLAAGLLLSLIPMTLIAIPYVTLGGLQATLALPGGVFLSWLPWLVLFSITNGFFEELWFRGSWLPRFAAHLGPTGALVATSLVFTLMHVAVYWNQPIAILLQFTAAWTVLGFSCGWLTHKTGSLWGAVFTHSFADFLFITGTFAAMG